ncbi:MAG: PAS domain S-box protein [Gallionella sp.]|nr:PAS domain S-box protein [Gallionella sp.]
MLEPPDPFDEADRIAALRALAILDTPPEERFDRLTRLAQHLFGVPVALVSLIDSQRQWFKSSQGLEVSETPRNISFCGHAILDDRVFLIPDAALDPRFADNPLVSGVPHIRFYAGYPLTLRTGQRAGTLCVIDYQPREVSAEQLNMLRDLAQCVSEELEWGRQLARASEHALFQARYVSIIASSEDAIISKTLDGVITTWNPAAVALFGYTKQEAVGQRMAMLIPPGRENEESGILARILRGERIEHFETVRLSKGGQLVDVSVSISPILDEDGKITGTSRIVRDITGRVKIERMKAEFISTVSHELRTPLTSIRGSLGLMAGGVAGELPPQAKSLVDVAYKNCERLILLVNDILDMEKIEAGKMDFHPQTIRLIPLLKQALEGNMAYAQQFGVTYELAGDLSDVTLFLDINRFLQVMANLLSNAAKFSPAGAKVLVAVNADDSRVRISVSDQGCGIPGQFRGQIFQKFSQADSSDTRKKGGTGLGLVISRAIVEQMGGKIGFDSKPDVLTVFYVEFPLWRQPIPAGADEA